MDTDSLNSYLAQMFDGLIESEETEKQKAKLKKRDNSFGGGIHGQIALSLFGKGINSEAEATYNHLKSVENEEIVKDVQTKLMHDNAFNKFTEYLKKNELLKGQAVGQFVSITDTFYIFDIEFYQKLFADNGFMDSLKYFQDAEVDKNAEESFNSLNRESRRSDNVKKQKEELVDNAKNENEKNIEVLKKLVNMLSSVIPYPQILCIANYAVVLNEKYLRDDIKTAAFKYGGKITVVGYITNKISGQANTPISAFANVNQSMNALVNIFFENADETYVVHPIAVYYDN